MGASATAGFLLTLLVHATLWFAAAWALARGLRSAVWRARVWRGAALGGVVSAALALALDTTRLDWSWAPAAAPAAAHAPAIDPPANGVPITLSGDPPAAERTLAAPVRRAPPTAAEWSWSEIAVGLWALGALAALARLALDRRRLARALAGRLALRDRAWTDDLRELSRSAGLTHRPRLSVAEGLSSPLALARGEIVVPARALRELARDEQRALLAHELAHLARRDPHWLALLGVVERVFWFQPLVRACGRRASAAAELCCDEA
ncbi:MAG TPA: M56 family metallopeptidase, partial [Planctomycetota bacterium]|nr:M56 family metallopeptidase [Planctomycetota bacterium]